ncbi:hypothetical protein [Actinobacillus equuli]|uniref:hypothetical protein n=1 Tax=Actinobacillus TaxID=713 RepID=UPI0024427909|nr:hypothetical protein [Actinobacillus equuli]WGE65606.1 hypothetical protein NYR76_01205 [Actinobacillus equuli subsp. equuli]WGE83693.1 hypothetical protein NYR86_00895 [Actinobacillus equuli subsp. equuli]
MCNKVLKTISRRDKNQFLACCHEFAELTKDSPEAIAAALAQGIQQFEFIEDKEGKLNIRAELYDKDADFYPNVSEMKETENG